MTDARRRLGARAEAEVAARLAARGWSILDRNWRCPLGEIDLVARDGDCLVVVEVRARREGGAMGAPEESVDGRKARRLARLGWAYVQRIGWEGPWRIDVAAVIAGPGGAFDVTLYESAVEE